MIDIQIYRARIGLQKFTMLARKKAKEKYVHIIAKEASDQFEQFHSIVVENCRRHWIKSRSLAYVR